MSSFQRIILAFGIIAVTVFASISVAQHSPTDRMSRVTTVVGARGSTPRAAGLRHSPITAAVVTPPPPSRVDLKKWSEAVWYAAATKNAATAPVPQGLRPSEQGMPREGPAVSVAAPPGLNCGGTDFPPCYVAQRESGNTYTAYNPTGCGGSGCYGRWQFSGAWAGKLGLPLDLSKATPAQQDAAARLLWNGGAGCSNWAACS